MAVLSLARVEKLIRKTGAERVSKDASKELALVLEERAVEISLKQLNWLNTRGGKQ
jgi:histone H3/H4